ncbi:Hypothetical_protein [Hexamita inflata]|uniref:Hypothetical_protein n=1 Tax=Hexamita inflata TaxID=28002 RepID=A0AA86QP69_9EUKA|nr:Hypothetical protein HINF_LOCUS45382 [Hexamita inflata]
MIQIISQRFCHKRLCDAAAMKTLLTAPKPNPRSQPKIQNVTFTQRANEEAKLHFTSLITNALHEGTIATKQGQRDRQATGRSGLPGQEGEAQCNAGSDGLGVTADIASAASRVWEQGQKATPGRRIIMINIINKFIQQVVAKFTQLNYLTLFTQFSPSKIEFATEYAGYLYPTAIPKLVGLETFIELILEVTILRVHAQQF